MNSHNGGQPNPVAAGKCDSARLNRHELLERLLGDGDLLAEMVQIFLLESATHLADLNSAVNSGDAKKLYAAAHTLKGAVGNFAAPLATESVARLEEIGRSGDISGAADEFSVLRREMRLLEPLLLEACREASQ
ncbi:MAG: Hpt domain-containing protein [Candidatus Acidiferrales bacterium]